jgi:hypothetical protein
VAIKSVQPWTKSVQPWIEPVQPPTESAQPTTENSPAIYRWDRCQTGEEVREADV